MKRGERIAVLSVISVVAVLAATGLVLTPTGQVPQNVPIYPTSTASSACQMDMVILQDTNVGTTYCCLEDMIGANTCKLPFTIIKAK